MILQTLVLGAQHGQGIARSIFLVDHGSLYLSLQRLEEKGEIKGEWGLSDNNRRARFYHLTALGRKRLTRKAAQWHKIAKAMSLILGPASKEA